MKYFLICLAVVGIALLAGTVHFTKKTNELKMGEGEVTTPIEKPTEPTVKPLPATLTINGKVLDTTSSGKGSYAELKAQVIAQLKAKEPVNIDEFKGVMEAEQSRCQIGLKDYSVQMEELYSKILTEGVCL